MSILFEKDINYSDIFELHKKLNNLTPNLLQNINSYNIQTKHEIEFISKDKKFIEINLAPYKSFTSNFYKNTSIERTSKILTECSNTLEKNTNNFLK